MTILLLNNEPLPSGMELSADVIWRWDGRKGRLECVKNRDGAIGTFPANSEPMRHLVETLLFGLEGKETA